eukprot:TRINITY_DN1880_c0_g5_i2.p1 TRINITY_DN1880_c0_g5~~TRINITY_DN1880_c0_g5_i2.p1  ORF type:complete len:274 (-),score=30.35 TRINITY_DN1880_c0_g5_i2:130-951(-)
MNPRKIKVYVSEVNGKSVGGMTINVIPRAQVVDHIFRFFEQENRFVELAVPVINQITYAPTRRPEVRIIPAIGTREWISDKEMQIQLKTLPSGQKQALNMLVYEDGYLTTLLSNFIIEVHSLAGFDVNVSMGQLVTLRLTFPADKGRAVRCYTSHPSVTYFPSPFDKDFSILQGEINTINLNVRSYAKESQKVLINLVDINTKELLFAWTINVVVSYPKITKVFDVICPIGQESIHAVPYVNRTAAWSIFEFVSSNPEIARLQVNYMSLSLML